MSTKIGIVSLGCSKNQVDAERLLHILQKAGYILVDDIAKSDVCIINTCGFIQSAKEEAIDNIIEVGKLKAEGTIKGIVVTGCLAQRYGDEILNEMPEVNVVVELGCNGDIIDAVETALSTKRKIVRGNICELPIEGGRILSTPPQYGYLKIAEGCDNCCSYCAIPAIRGRYRSVPMETVLDEARWLVSNGVREVVLIAQDCTRYGEDIYNSLKLPSLLRELCKIDGIYWIRVMYCYPDKITDELLEVIANEEKIVKYLDIPIQHCSEKVLANMNRSGNVQKLTELFAHIRKVVPNITIRTTLMVGFPDESDDDFLELCEFVKAQRFERLGCFCYSAEEGTKAALMPQIDDDIKEKREEIIMTSQQRIMSELNASKIGSTIQVLVEGFDEISECYFGRSADNAPEIDCKVFFDSEDAIVIGSFKNIKITEVLVYDLVGEIV